MNKLALFGGKKIRNKPYVSTAIIENEERQNVNKVLKSGMLSGFIGRMGPSFYGGTYVKKLETEVKKYFKVKHAVSVNSATAGLHVAVGACKIGPGDEVIVPPYTMSATATAIVMQGATPVFSDICPENYCLDPDKLEAKITKKTKAIIVVHLFGQSAEMQKIMKTAKKHGLYVIEDCAQSPGATYNGKYAGTIGDIGIFSLNQHKTITCGEGGFAVTNNDKLALRMQLMRNHGEAVVSDIKDSKDNYDIVGYNYRMTELEAAVSLGQFKRLDKLNNHRIKLAEYLLKKLSKYEFLDVSKPKKDKHVYFVLPIKFNADKIGISRTAFVKAILAEGIPMGAGYVKPIYLEPLYKEILSKRIKNAGRLYREGVCPVCEDMHYNVLLATAICRHPHSIKDMDDFVRAVDKVYKNRQELKG